ncbi:MAG: hypothetical protein J3Q66DRAFT_195609 [Benniella sp.]|nr:MAG: hypothetical protein J3Q66DRAFT_195609 [Benniella sp.]
MLGWSKSSCTGKEVRIKPAKEPKPQIVIVMPRRKKEFGMGTFSTEPADSIEPEQIPLPSSSSQPQQPQVEPTSAPLSKISGELCDHILTSPSHEHEPSQSGCGDALLNEGQFQLQSSILSLHPLPQSSGNHLRRDQPLGTPATPGSADLATPHSARTSYFPATPASCSTDTSVWSTSTVAFGGQNNRGAMDPPCSNTVPERDSCNVGQQEQVLSSTATSSSFEAKRQLPRVGGHSGVGGSYPTPASSSHAATTATATSWTTSRTPGSMSEWRLMQMELQQDNFSFSLTYPPVNPLSPSISSPSFGQSGSRMLVSPSTAFGTRLSPMSIPGSTVTSASISSLSACSCCCSSNTNAHSNPSLSAMRTTVADANETQSTARQCHSFLLHSRSPGTILEMAASLAGESGATNSDGENRGGCAIRQSWTESVLSQQQQRLSMYNHCNNSNTSNDYFSSREVHVQEMEPGHGLGLTLGTMAGSAVTLNSDTSENEHSPQCSHQLHLHHHCHHQQSSPVVPTGPMSAGLTHTLCPRSQSRPISAVGSHIESKSQQCCRNCPRQSQRVSMISKNVAGRERPVTGSGEGENGAEQTLGGFDLEVSRSSTSLPGPTRFNPMRRVSSLSSLRPFKSLSSKLSANALKKLSTSQKSQLNGSKEDPESHRLRDMELNYPSSLFRQKYANYNFERQMEDFERAAREFKEEKESVEANSGWLLISQHYLRNNTVCPFVRMEKMNKKSVKNQVLPTHCRSSLGPSLTVATVLVQTPNFPASVTKWL